MFSDGLRNNYIRTRISFRWLFTPNSLFVSILPWTGWVGAQKLTLPPGARTPRHVTVYRMLLITTKGWMWHVSAVVSRILLKNEPAGTTETLTNIQVKVSTLQTLLTTAKDNCKSKPRMLVQQEQIVAWNTFYAFIPWCVLLISWLLRFWREYIHRMVMCYWICAIIQRWLQ